MGRNRRTPRSPEKQRLIAEVPRILVFADDFHVDVNVS